MAVDVQSEIEIARPRVEVAAFASDPDNALAWYENIASVEWRTPRPVAVGARFAFVAQFLGRRLSYTYEVRELVPDERLVMSTDEGPFLMEMTYAWSDTADGGNRMTLRNQGPPPHQAASRDGLEPRVRAVQVIGAPGFERIRGASVRHFRCYSWSEVL